MKPKAELQFTPEQCDLMHASVGMTTEASELLSAVKAHVIYGVAMSADYKKGQTLLQNIVEELGDAEFFMEHLRKILGITREETLAANMAKLAKRYPGYNYTDAKAKERADKAEDGWIEWNGGECPVDTATMVDFVIRDESIRNVPGRSRRAGSLKWDHAQKLTDIIAYRIAK